MIGTIRRHTKWLWFIIIAAMIVSLVWFFLPNARSPIGSSTEGPVSDLGSAFGQPITPQQLDAAEREGRLFFRLRTGDWPPSDDDKQIKAWAEQRLFLDAELRVHHITVTDEAAARYAKQMMGVRPDDVMPMDRLNQFIQNELMTRGHLAQTPAGAFQVFDQFVRHQAGQEYLISLYGMSGKLITDKEAEFFYRRENEPMVVETADFPASDYYAQSIPTEAQLKDYFEKHEADYRIPDRIQVNYIEFSASNYFGQADKQLGTNINDRIDELYHQQGPDAYKDENGKTLSQADAEAKIKFEVRIHTALALAQSNAEVFVTAMAQGHDDDHPYTKSNIFTLARADGLTVQTTPPFDARNGTPLLDVPPNRLPPLFELTNNAEGDKENSMLYYPSPLVGSNAVYVIGLDKQYPSRLRTLAEVRAQVEKDYRKDKSMQLAKDAGERFAAALQAGLADGKSFDAICSAQFIRPDTLAPFSLTTETIPEIKDKAEFEQLASACFMIPTGQSSKLIPTPDGGIVAYVRNRLPVDQAAMAKKMPDYLDRMRQQRQIAAFEEWFGKEMQQHFVAPASDQTSAG